MADKQKINISAPALEALYTGRPMRQDVVSERKPSARELLAEKMQKSLERIMPEESARKAARKLTGHTYGMGVADITPAGIPLWAYEGGEALAKAYEAAGEGKYGTAALEGLMGAMGVAPGVHAAGKIVPEALNVGAAAVGKRLEPLASRAAQGVLERGGLPAQMLQDIGRGGISPLTVWHGSPHRFPPVKLIELPDGTRLYQNMAERPELMKGAEVIQDFPEGRFDMSKIGTGEGAQAYGHGLYFAEAPGVAEAYQKNLSAERGFSFARKTGLTRDEVLREVKEKYGSKYLDNVATPEGVADRVIDRFRYGDKNELPRGYKEGSERAKLFKDLQGQIEHTDPGALYKVDIPDEAVARMLDWDKPLSEQHPDVRKAVNDLIEAEELYKGKWAPRFSDKRTTGGEIVQVLNEALKGPSVTSSYLRELGIPGIKYLDEGSRAAGEGTRNFVLFDELLPRILEVNEKPTGALPWRKGEWEGKPQYPQAEALETARKNAVTMLGLPENNTAMDRARAMGYESAYHGTKTPEKIENLIPGGTSESTRTGDAYGLGIYSTTDPFEASSYAGEGGVLPLMLRRESHLPVDNPSPEDLSRLSSLAGEQMLPSDKARFSVGRKTRQFENVEDARDFFANQRENWHQFGGGYDRARPEAIAHPGGGFAVEFTDFDAPVPITSGEEANTLLRAIGWDAVPSMGYAGHTLNRGGGRQWDVTTDPSKLRSRFAAFDPARMNENDLLGYAQPSILPYTAGAGALGGLGLAAMNDKQPPKKKGTKNGK